MEMSLICTRAYLCQNRTPSHQDEGKPTALNGFQESHWKGSKIAHLNSEQEMHASKCLNYLNIQLAFVNYFINHLAILLATMHLQWHEGLEIHEIPRKFYVPVTFRPVIYASDPIQSNLHVSNGIWTNNLQLTNWKIARRPWSTMQIPKGSIDTPYSLTR